jgi:hypothetical protein
VLNSGHRKGGNVRRLIKGRPQSFSTFAPMAIAAMLSRAHEAAPNLA